MAASFEDRLRQVLTRTEGKVGPEVARQLHMLIEPTSLAIMAGVIVIWLGSHAFGVGEALDLVLGVVGFVAIGLSVFEGLDELVAFARGTMSAQSDADYDRAASHLARAIGILGIQAVLAIVMRGRAPTGRGPALLRGAPPPRTPGLRYRPGTVGSIGKAAGTGGTTFWGDISFSTQGSLEDQRLVLLHEKVHQFLAPKLYLMREVRVQGRIHSYFRSSLYRWFEEMLAETFARMKVLGFNPKQFWLGFSFPVKNEYVFLLRGGGYSPAMAGKGVLVEGAALLARGEVLGIPFQIYSRPGGAPPR